MKPIKTIATHDGNFHADEVFAIAILKLIYPKAKIIRTRHKGKLKNADMRVDVGGEYNIKTDDYDHHQDNFREKRSNGIPFASAGLIWKHFGRKLVMSQEGWQYIEDALIQPIDAHDNGVKVYTTDIIEPFTIGHIISTFVPKWDEESTFYREFMQAMRFAQKLMLRMIDYANSIEKGNKKIRDALKESDGTILFMERPMPPMDRFLCENSKIKFVIYKHDEGKWRAKTVPKKFGNFALRVPFPKEWGGLMDEDLQEVTGVKDAMFCHKALFIAGANSKEGIIKMVNIALEQSNK
jgi:uncharacterized UPF0160 family protein